MLPPFNSVNDFLQILTGKVYAGANRQNLRDQWVDVTGITFNDSFKMPGSNTTINGAWTQDAGDLTIPFAIQEPRAFCQKGKCSVTVNGTAIIIRVEVNSGWGSAALYIDGQKPSTISGLKSFKDTVDCNFDNYAGLTGVQYIDILVADGLPAGNHLIELYSNYPRTDGNGFFAISGVKTRQYAQNGYTASGWHADVASQLNVQKITLENLSSNLIANVSVTIPSGVVKPDGSSFGGTLNVGTIAPQASYDILFSIDGTQLPDTTTKTLGLTAQYVDPNGTISQQIPGTYACNSTVFTYSTGWSTDNDTPDGELRTFNSKAGNSFSFVTTDTQVTFKLQRDSGWGTANVTVGGTNYGVLTSNDSVGGGFLATQQITGLPAGSKTVVVTCTSAKPFAFVSAQYNSTLLLSQVSENIPVTYNLAFIPPFAPPNPRLVNGKMVWDITDVTKKDNTIPRDNSGVYEYDVYARFPTFAVYYARGRDDILSSYDIVVIEPTAVSAAQVAAWQAQGIKVLGYVSFGEEDGVRANFFDLADDSNVPWTDDGAGVGGYASYYLKGGYKMTEANECQFDDQRNGNKVCTVGNPHYFQGTGRCSDRCQNDSMLGFNVQQAGGACKAGYTSANNWQRDATNACVTKTCPSYTPFDTKCPQYQQVSENNYAIDLTIADPTYPDQNGPWGASYCNPLAPRWKQKLLTHYLPVLFNKNQLIQETLTLQAYTGPITGDPTFVAQVSGWPFDDLAPFSFTTLDKSYTYVANVDYGYDSSTGAIVFAVDAGDGTPATAVTNGTQVIANYYKKGLNCDGVFMDTVDDVDIYPDPVFANGMASLINYLKSQYQDRDFCSNRGFTVFPQIVPSCDFIMLESVFSDYDMDTGQYHLVTDPDSVAFNDQQIAMIQNLRRSFNFDVICLNYAPNDSSGDAIRQSVTNSSWKNGFMSWVSVINLDAPLPNNGVTISDPSTPIQTNIWQRIIRKKAP